MTKPTCYVAAPFQHQDEARAVRALFEQNGIITTSNWIDFEDSLNRTDEYMTRCAVTDKNDVSRADVLVVLNLTKSEGKSVETGIALAQHKPVIVVGNNRDETLNIFHWLPEVIHVGDAVEALQLLLGAQYDRAKERFRL